MTAELVPLQGLTAAEVADLVRVVPGTPPGRWGAVVHGRSGGHPFFARELCRAARGGGDPTDVPAAVREVDRRRLARLSACAASLVGAAAVAGATLLRRRPGRGDADPAAGRALTAVAEAAGAGVPLGVPTGPWASPTTCTARPSWTPLSRRRAGVELHHRIATALLRRPPRARPRVRGRARPAAVAAAVPVAGSRPRGRLGP